MNGSTLHISNFYIYFLKNVLISHLAAQMTGNIGRPKPEAQKVITCRGRILEMGGGGGGGGESKGGRGGGEVKRIGVRGDAPPEIV